MDYIGYCIRVDAIDGYADKLPSLKLYDDFSSIIGVKHQGATKENPHYHFVIRTNVRDQAMRVRLRKIFNQGKGNAHMGMKAWDGQMGAISYLFHEDPDAVVVLRHNISDDTIAEAKKMNRLVQQLVTDNKLKASWRAEEIVYEEIVRQRTKRADAGEREVSLSDTQIGQRILLTCLRTGKYTPQPWLVRAMVQRIQFKLLNGHEEDEEAFAMRLARNIFYEER